MASVATEIDGVVAIRLGLDRLMLVTDVAEDQPVGQREGKGRLILGHGARIRRMAEELTTADGWPLVALNDDGIRPAGDHDRCFYCRQSVGHPHARTCVIVNKIVRLKYIIEVDVEVPHHWTKDDIEFHRNDSSWCANNAVEEIEKHATEENGKDCLCHRFTCEFVRDVDATPIRKLDSPEEVQARKAVRQLRADN